MLGKQYALWAGVAVLGAAVAALAGEGQERASAEQIGQWVRQLDADRYGDRETATARLTGAGKTAIPALAKAAAEGSLEVSTRALRILRKFLDQPDEATKSAAKEALEQLAQSDCPSAAKAREAMAPKTGLATSPPPNNFWIQAAPGMAFPAPIPLAGGNARRVRVRTTNGVRDVDVEENDRSIKIHDDPQKGISVEVTTTRNGQKTTLKHEAKNAEELKKKHPPAYDLYKQYGQPQVAPAAIFQVQIAAGNPIPIPANFPPVPPLLVNPQPTLANPLDSAARTLRMCKTLANRVDVAATDEQLRRASKESRDALKKQLSDLRRQMADVEQRIEKAAAK